MCSVFRCAPSGAATASQPARDVSGQRPRRVVQRGFPVARSTATIDPSFTAKKPRAPFTSATPPGINGGGGGSATLTGSGAAASIAAIATT